MGPINVLVLCAAAFHAWESELAVNFSWEDHRRALEQVLDGAVRGQTHNDDAIVEGVVIRFRDEGATIPRYR